MRPRAEALLRAVPLLFLVPVAAGFAVAFARLFATAHPVYGFGMTINADAEAMYLGIWPFHDPATGFTGDAYTPLFPMVVSALDHLKLWTGWSVVVAAMSTLGLGALVASLAYRTPRAQTRTMHTLALLEAAGIGALAISFAFGLLRPAIFDARADQLAWLLGCSAIVLTPSAALGSPRRKLVVALLLTAAFWAKQTAIIASLATFTVVVLYVLGRRLRMRTALVWIGGLVALNGLLVAGLAWATNGWQYRFNFEIHLPVARSVGDVLPDLALRALPAIVFVAVVALAAFLALRNAPRDRLATASPGAMQAAGFAVMVLLGGFAGVYLRRFAGGDDNSLLPFLWGLALLGALAYRVAGRTFGSAVVAAIACVALFATTLAPGHARWRLRAGAFIPAQSFSDLPPAIDRLAVHTLIWDSLLSDLNVAHQHVIYPNTNHIEEALLRNARPTTFERALLGRHFGVIFGFPTAAQDFAGAAGVHWEDNYFWKLDRVIGAKYERAPRLPATPAGPDYQSAVATQAWTPRPGPDPAPWMNACFSPFRLMGATFLIHRGGGFWCVPRPGVLVLRETPAPLSEVVSTEPLGQPSGVLRVNTNAAPGSWSLVSEGAWTLRARAGDPNLGQRFDLFDGSGRAVASRVLDRRSLHAAHGTVEIAIGHGNVLALGAHPGRAALSLTLPAASPGRLHFWATQNSDARFDLRALSLRGAGAR